MTAQQAAAFAAAGTAARGGNAALAAEAAQAAAEGLRAAAAGNIGAPSEEQCTVEEPPLPPGGIANQLSQIRGPNPVIIGRLPRNGSATVSWDFLVRELRTLPGQLVFQTFAAADSSEGLPFHCDARFLEQVSLLNLVTEYGELDIVFEPAGTEGYDELAGDAERYDLDGLVVSVASLKSVIESKRSADRQKDRATLPTLEALLAERNRKG